MNFSDLTASLRLNISNFTNAMNNVRRQVQRFSSSLAAASTEGTADRLIAGYTSLSDRLHKVGLGLRDIARISSGIMVSQTFYAITRSVREATGALWDFNESLDYAQVTYSALFGSAPLATDFIDTLKQFSIDTIFEYTDIEGMARKLSAYGIEYKNLMYIIEGLTNLGTISGDTAALERLAVAIGQINAKGKLSAEEMRQLANAYVPIYDILRDKLGLTEEELKSVGDLGISSADAINAIIEYANETFGATADAAVNTITGLNNRIVDSLKVMGADMMQPLTAFYKSFAKFLADGLAEIQTIYETSGIGGVFEHLVPDEEWQQRIRSLIASLSNFMKQLIASFITLWPYIRPVIGGLIDAFTVLLTVINAVMGGLTGLFQTMANNTPVVDILTKSLVMAAAAWLLFKIQALGAMIVKGVSVAIVGVAKAVLVLTTALTAHPIVAILTLLGVALIGISANASNANSAISNLIDKLNSYSLGGDTADDILQAGDAMEEGTDKSDKFWESMEEGASDAEDSIEGAGNAAKKASKSLLSFDEVFRLNDPTESGLGGAGNLGGIEDLAGALGGLGAGIAEGLEIPDLSSYADNFVSTLYNELWESIKTIASGIGTGALIGALVGFTIGAFATGTLAGALTGAKWGSKIGAIAGGAFAGFWTDAYKEMEGTLLNIASGAAIGTLIGGLTGLVIGAFATKTLDGALTAAKYGASFGGLIGGSLGAFWSLATEEMSNAIEGIIAGSSAGFLIGGLAGLLIGAFATRKLDGALYAASWGMRIGTLLGGIFGGVFGAAENELSAQIDRIVWGGAEGALIGGLAGMIIGAFATKSLKGALAGAKWGASIGGILGGAFRGIFGDAEKAFEEGLSGMFSGVSSAGTGALIGGLVGMLVGAIVGIFAGGTVVPMAKAGAMLGTAIGGLAGLVVDYLNNAGIIEGIVGWFGELGAKVTNWLIGLGSSILNWFINSISAVSNFFVNIWNVVSTWFTDLISSIGTWFADLWNTISTWFSNTASSIGTWLADLWNTISAWFSNTASSIGTWFADLWNTISTWFTDLVTSIGTWLANAWTNVSSALTSAWTNITTWFSNLWNSISKWFTDLVSSVKTWWESLWDTSKWSSGWTKVTTWFSSLSSSISSWFTSLIGSISTWWNNLWDTSSWVSGWSAISGWFSDLFTSIKDWFTNMGSSISNWWGDIWEGVSGDAVDGENRGSLNGRNPAGQVGKLIPGHAKGGIFNREHIARFAEGNKAEAIIPLEDQTHMQPFVTAISDGILQGLLPAMSSGYGNSNSLPPMYVGTLIADERGLQQLYKKFELYEAKEMARKGSM